MSSVEEEKEDLDVNDTESSEESEVETPEVVDIEDEAPEVEPEPATPAEEVEKWKDLAARSQAEFDNYRKRMARERTEAIVYANRSLLEQLLPVIDNFEMGLKAAKDTEGDSSMILQGMTMVHKQLEDFLNDQGVEVIPSDGLPFDPNLHEALKQEASDEVEAGHIIYTMRRGFRLKERILRAANVVVSSGPAEEA
ncbi:MAG: nucleotide exchange factor GrpE [Verrucomicrobiales bacterium]|nr:nucleotide exchange factor GrpE [Verrucomicrobiales bacterium]